MLKHNKIIDSYIIILFSGILLFKYTIFSNFFVFKYIFPLLASFSYFLVIMNIKQIINLKYIKTNILIVFYFIFKLIILFFFKLDVTSFIYDGFFLIIIYTFIDKTRNNLKLLSKIIVYFTVIFNMVCTLYIFINFAIYNNLNVFYIYGGKYFLKGMYTNSNGMGLLSFYAFILFITFLKDDQHPKKNLLLSFFLIIFIILSGSRTALLALTVFLLYKKILSLFSRRFLVTTFCVGLSSILCFIFCLFYINKNNVKLTPLENKINSLSTNRYLLNKYSVLSVDDIFIGINKKEVAEKRFQKMPFEIKRDLEYSRISLAESNNNNHNGYIQTLVVYGLIIFITFMLILFQGLYKTNKLVLPLIFSILIVSLFENELLLSLGLPLFILLLCLGYNEKRNYKYNTNKILYINYINMDDMSSGSFVRPNKMYRAFLKNGNEVKLLTGSILKLNKKQRNAKVKEVKKWLKKYKPKYCYIESPSGPLIFREDKNLIKYINDLNIPTAYFYRDCYYKFPRIYVFNENFKIISKQFLKYLYHYINYFFNNSLINNYVDIVYMPSLKMGDYFNFKDIRSLPPAADGCLNIKNNSNKKIIYVGGISKNYGTDLLLESLEIINQKSSVELLLICRESELKEINPKYLNKRWLKIIHESGKELEQFYLQAKIAILPKIKNTYNDFAISVKLFEYLSYCLPIVATSTLESDKIIINNDLGLVVKENSAELASAILKLYNDEELYNRKVDNIKKYINNEGLWIHRVKKIEEDFKNGEYYEN